MELFFFIVMKKGKQTFYSKALQAVSSLRADATMPLTSIPIPLFRRSRSIIRHTSVSSNQTDRKYWPTSFSMDVSSASAVPNSFSEIVKQHMEKRVQICSSKPASSLSWFKARLTYERGKYKF